MKLGVLQLLLVARATSTPADTWVGELTFRTYQPQPPAEGGAPSEPNACQQEGFLGSNKIVQTTSFKLDETWYCESGKTWQTTAALADYNMAGIPTEPDATFFFQLGTYAIGDPVPIEEVSYFAKYHWSCTADGRMKRNAYSCIDDMCTTCDDTTPIGVTYDAGTSVTDFGPVGDGVCLGMELDQPPGPGWAKFHWKVLGSTTTSGDFSVAAPAIPSCDGNDGGDTPPSGLHLAADDAKIIFGPNGECEIRKVPGESKLVSTCAVESP